MTTNQMLRKLQELGYELQPGTPALCPEVLHKWAFIDPLDPEEEQLVTSGDNREDLILETYEGLVLEKYRD